MTRLKAGYGLDNQGYIISDVSVEKINPVFLPCIRDSVERLRVLFQYQLHSVYVYGSVPRGDAVISKSDLDVIAMFHGELSSREKSVLKELAQGLSAQYESLVRDVGIAVANYQDIMDPKNYYENAFIKEISVCVFGEDVGEQFGPYKLSAEIAISFNGDIGDMLARTLEKLNKASEREWHSVVQNFSRKLIRTYYSMVMVRSQIWTTRLAEQAEVFIKYFPEKASVVGRILEWLNVPPQDQETVYELFEMEGNWAAHNFHKEVVIN